MGVMVSSPLGSLATGCEVKLVAGENVSEALNLNGATLCGIQFPSGFSNSTVVKFQMCDTFDGEYVPVFTQNNETYQFSFSTKVYVFLDHKLFAGINFLKLEFDGAEEIDLIMKCASRGF